MKEHWLEINKRLLDSAFLSLKNTEASLSFKKTSSILYPAPRNWRAWTRYFLHKLFPRKIQYFGREREARLEALCRTLLLAVPILKKEPDYAVNGIVIAEYYRHLLEELVNPASDDYLPISDGKHPSQDLCELGILALCLFICDKEIWEPLSEKDKQKLYTAMMSYGKGATLQSNWRFFNIFILSFFKMKGYEVDEACLEELLHKSLADYRGQGWYVDGVENNDYTYYSMWGYQLYGQLWSRYFGEKHYPEIADQFYRNYLESFKSYPFLFSREGQMPMYGRSNLYRFASISSLAWAKEDADVNWGWMRHIAKGCLQQFVNKPGFMLDDGVPSPGFYGPFDPVLQNYSCRGSVYWLAKGFLPLLLPDSHPFWTAEENEGEWEEMDPSMAYNIWNPTAKLLITDYPHSGASEIRIPPTQLREWYLTENYNRLAYNSLFPWMADDDDGTVTMAYRILDGDKWECPQMVVGSEVRFENNCLRREAFLRNNDAIKIRYQETIIPYGIYREDLFSTDGKPFTLRLGHYSLPQHQVPFDETTIEIDNFTCYLLFNGEYCLALVPIGGWNKVSFITKKGLHPETKFAATINASAVVDKTTTIRTCLLHKRGMFTQEELSKALHPYIKNNGF